MSTAVARKNPKLPFGLSSIFSRLSFGLLLIVGMAGLSITLILGFGRCTGEEFSSRDFSRRTFYYFRIPLIKLQVTPIIRRPKTSSLVSHLRNNQLIPKVGQNWQLASLAAGADRPYEADELILCRYLDQRNNEYDLRWLAWSQKNPRLAKAFWPVVARVANEDLYLLIPDLFQLARYATDPVQLDADLRKLVIRDGARLAAGEYQLANYDRAAQIAAFVLALAGDKDDWDQSIAAAAKSAAKSQTAALKRDAKPFASALPRYDSHTVDSQNDQTADDEHPPAESLEPPNDTADAADATSSGVDNESSPDRPSSPPDDAE